MSKIYKQNSSGSFSIGNKTIPNDESNRDFKLMQKEVSDGQASIETNEVQLDQYKLDKKNAIDKRTDELILLGFNHNSTDFKINLEKEVAAIALNNVRMAGGDMAGKKFRAKNRGYTFASTADFDAFFQAGFGRLESLINDGSDLKDAIEDCTTVAEVDAISDDRT